MQLYYYKDKLGNFGDDLNPWLWNQLCPELFNQQADPLFVGIGTLINHRLPKEPKKIIFGAGVGYGSLPNIDDSFDIRFVRGTLSAAALHLDSNYAMGDPGILIRKLWPRSAAKKYKFSYMPHHDSTGLANWQGICSAAGVNYISPAASIESILQQISQTEVMICEAMHAAIISDALDIPWISTRSYPHIDTFKWMDWLSVYNMRHLTHDISEVWDEEFYHSRKEKCKSQVKRILLAFNIWDKKWLMPPLRYTRARQYELATEQLVQICQTGSPRLSESSIKEALIDKIDAQIDKLKMDSGKSAW